MKILQLTKKFPYPLKDGESIAVTNLSKSLIAAGCQMTLLSMNTSKHYIEIDSLPDSYDHYEDIHTVFLDNRVTLSGAFANLFSRESYHVSRFDFEDYRSALIGILKGQKFDIVQLETLYLAPYIETIREVSDAKIVMRSHNVEYEIWERVVASTSLWTKRKYLSHLTSKLKRFETNRLLHYDALVTVTQRDLDQYRSLGYKGQGISSPIGVDIRQYDAQPIDTNLLSFSFIGSLDWMPNLDGLGWFLSYIWPRIIGKYPSATMHIAGRHTPPSIVNLASDHIIVHGEVDDAHAFLLEHPISVVPLLSGSGMRVKVLEAMALGRVVLSTKIGAEGIDAEDGREILIADSSNEMLDRIDRLVSNPGMMISVGAAARAFIGERFDQDRNARDLIDFYKGL